MIIVDLARDLVEKVFPMNISGFRSKTLFWRTLDCVITTKCTLFYDFSWINIFATKCSMESLVSITYVSFDSIISGESIFWHLRVRASPDVGVV